MFSTKCPKCGSDNVTKKFIDKTKFAKGVIGGEIKVKQKNCKFKCHKCGYSWEDVCAKIEGGIGI